MSYDKPLITLYDTTIDAVTKLSKGNPGAASALFLVATAAEKVDPDSALGVWGPLFQLDNLNMYGSDVWLLYSDLCERDVVKTLAVLRANQLGYCTEQEIRQAWDVRNAAFADSMLKKVQERLPAFGKEN